jgi:hypothetical protein
LNISTIATCIASNVSVESPFSFEIIFSPCPKVSHLIQILSDAPSNWREELSN